MSESTDSIAEAIRRRVVSASLGTYLFFWIVLHWEGVYTTLFTSQELIFKKFKLLKNEYVHEYFFGWHGWETVWLYIAPAILTVLFIWPIPKYVLVHLYRQEQRHKVDKRRIRIEEEEKFQKARESLAVQEKEAVKAEVEVSQELKRASDENPTILWQRDLIDFVNNPIGGDALRQLKNTTYKDSGHLTAYTLPNGHSTAADGMTVETLALVDANGLVDIDKQTQTLDLTEKGKYFIAKMSTAMNGEKIFTRNH